MPRISQPDTPDVSNTQKQRHLKGEWSETSSRVLCKERDFYLKSSGTVITQGDNPHWPAPLNPAHCGLSSTDWCGHIPASKWFRLEVFRMDVSGRLHQSDCLPLRFIWRLMDAAVAGSDWNNKVDTFSEEKKSLRWSLMKSSNGFRCN